MSGNIDMVIANIPDVQYVDETVQQREKVRVAQEVHDQLTRAIKRSKKIRKVDGMPVTVLGVNLIGITEVESIELMYRADGQDLIKEYSLVDFYKTF